jgi:hypothetical protein
MQLFSPRQVFAGELFYMGRHLVLTKQKIEEMKKAGPGQGVFADYQP